MPIVDEIRAKVRRAGGSAKRVETIESGLKELNRAAVNPLSGLLVDATIGGSVDLLGKVVGDLESGIEVLGNKIRGTVHYVTGYTGFSGVTEEQSGNYLALYYRVPDVSGVTIKVKGGKSSEVTLDPDGLHILRVVNPEAPLVVTVSKEGYPTIQKTFSIKDITYEKEVG